MKKQVLNGLKIIVLGLTLSAGISYATNWVAPAGSPPGNNAEAPINVGTTGQLKNGGLGVQGFVAWNNALFSRDVFVKDAINPSNSGDLYVHKLANGTNSYVCADSAGKLVLCGAPAASPECSDGIDNDGDGDIDFPADSGCTSSSDNDEDDGVTPPTTQCNDTIDNDGDGNTDFPDDLGCSSASDSTEQTNVAIYYTKDVSTGNYSIYGNPANFQAICGNCAPTTGIPRFIAPAGLSQISVTVVGGGGGGGGASIDSQYIGNGYGANGCVFNMSPSLSGCVRRGGGGGGGAGGITSTSVTVAPGWLYTIGVGSAGGGGVEDSWNSSNVNYGTGEDGGNSYFNGNATGAPYNLPAVNITVTGGKGGKGAFAGGSNVGIGGLTGSGQSTTPQIGLDGKVRVTKNINGSVVFDTGVTGGMGGPSGQQDNFGNGGYGGDALSTNLSCNVPGTCRGDTGRPGAVIISFSI
ncbi:MAG TPA: hypothetical protein PK886_01095 [Candidatus Paceibacterota bacterium]|nr:hypothetical protein [Candidatus Paceibacterota bacterium]